MEDIVHIVVTEFFGAVDSMSTTMAEKSKEIDVSQSLEGGSPESTLHDVPAESHYHEIDVFGREEDHDVSSSHVNDALGSIDYRRWSSVPGRNLRSLFIFA